MDGQSQKPDVTGASHPSLCHPVLARAKWNRKSGCYDYDRFQQLTSQPMSIGSALIDKVHIDCKLLFKKSRWGHLDGLPAGIIYMELDFHQPEDCRLTWASVQVSVADPREHGDDCLDTPVRMTTYFGPQRMVGPERLEHKARDFDFKPEIKAMSVTAKGVGSRHESSFAVSHRWELNGRLVPPHPRAKVDWAVPYKTVEWRLTENELEPGQGTRVQTAFAFENGGGMFLLKVEVQGGLRRLSRRIKEGIKACFHPRRGRKEDCSLTAVGPYVGPRERLDDLARDLEHEMVTENYRRRPVEIPKPQRPVEIPKPQRPPFQDVSSLPSRSAARTDDEVKDTAERASTGPTQLASSQSQRPIPEPTPTPVLVEEFPDTQSSSSSIRGDAALARLAQAGGFGMRPVSVTNGEEASEHTEHLRDHTRSSKAHVIAPSASTVQREQGEMRHTSESSGRNDPGQQRELHLESMAPPGREIEELRQLVIFRTISQVWELVSRKVRLFFGMPL